jgi:hypothetical protein
MGDSLSSDALRDVDLSLGLSPNLRTYYFADRYTIRLRAV